MGDYQPVDLTPWCNVGLEWLPNHAPAAGSQRLRGLPFQIGPESGGGPCLLGFGPGGYADAVTIPLQRPATWVLVAHRLLESHILEGEPPGHVVAVYRFGYDDGTAVAVPVRERFEIAEVPTRWGQKPFLAVADTPDWLSPRREGPWELIGRRQTEAHQGWPGALYLWAWRNPHPERALASIVVEPQDRPFCLAALTLSTLTEDPFGRQPGRPVTITLKDAGRAEQPFDLAVEVDRGVATYPYPLPAGSPQQFLEADHRGYGAPYHDRSSPAYVEIAAQPSATVRLKQGEEALDAVRWGDVVEQGVVETQAVRIELVDRGKNWVHVTVVDDATGQPVPCRVNFRSPEGIPYQPHGHHNHLLSDMGTWHLDVGGDVRLGGLTYAYIDGKCQGWLPRGEVLVDVARGFEYEPLRTTVQIQPGQRELTLRLQRWTDMNRERWFSGDTHVHFLSTPGAHLEAQGEDLNIVNLLQSQWGHLFTNTEDFVGRPVPSPDGRTVVYASQENRQHMLGHLILLGLKQPVMPWCTDGPDEAEMGGTLETTLSHWADECHRQGGTVILPHMPDPNAEPAALIATGRVDAVEMLRQESYRHIEYYRYLNGGYRLPLVGGTDKMSAEVPVGLYRTYVYIPPDEAFTHENWCRNLRLGRTFLSSGPLLRFTADGARLGDTLYLAGDGGTVEVEAEVHSIFPVHTLEIVQEGRVVASTEDSHGARHLHLRAKVKVDRHSWLAARASGPGYVNAVPHYDVWQRGIMAHTSPIYVAVGEEWRMASRETAQYMLTLLHGGLEYIRQRSVQHPAGTVTHHHDEHDHLAYLERPFQEAIAAVQRRLQELGT